MKLKSIGIGFCLALLGTSCGTLKTFRGDLAQRHIESPEGELAGYGAELATKFGLMSLFAETVYRRPYDGSKDSRISVCGDAESKDAGFLMPWVIKDNEKFAWSRYYVGKAIDVEPCFSGGGLYYETYVLKNSNDSIIEAVISYRGTDGLYHDMRTNLAAAFGREPAQYAEAKKRLKPLVKHLKGVSPDVNIYAVGHSLGGGLAQQAGYVSSEIEEVFTFNTSPITNWSSLALAKDTDIGIENHYPIIYRLNHGGEGLQPIRYITTLFTSARFNRYDIDIQITERKAVSGHAMRLISCRLAEEINSFPDGVYADHFYGKEFISMFMIDRPVAPGDEKTPVCRWANDT